MTLIARGATYNGSPNRPQKWDETYRRPDGSDVTIRFHRLQHTKTADLVSMRVLEPARYYIRLPQAPSAAELTLFDQGDGR